MKKFGFLALVAAGMLLGACADKDDTTENVVNPGDFKDGAFIGVSLSLPTASNTATRANDELNNGVAQEFEVKNATLYIFEEGSTAGEDNATFVAQYTLGTQYTADNQGAGSGNHEVQTITTKITSTSVAEATKISNELAGKIKAGTKKYYAYVIINNNGQGTIANGADFGSFKKTAFTKIGADIAKKMNIWPSGLLMTSSPISDTAGGSNAAPAAGDNYTTLVKLDKDCVFGSATEALESPAACVYVERAAVKITVEEGSSLNDKIDGLDLELLGWQVINYEPNFFNTRQINSSDGSTTAEDWGTYTSDFVASGATKYRFVTGSPFDPTLPTKQSGSDTQQATSVTHTTGYRTYFAYDPQYNKNAALSKTVASTVDADWIGMVDANGDPNHAYTTENTFDVAHQTWQNTTMVTLKAKVGDGSTDYYTVGKDSKTLLTETSAKAQIHNIILGNPTVSAAAMNLMNKIAENSSPGAVVEIGLNVTFNSYTAGKTGVAFTPEVAYKVDGSPATYGGTGEGDLRDALVNAITTFTASDAGKDALFTSLYKGGISYYNVRIKHFGDYETPWGITYNASATDKFIVGGGSGVNEIYFGLVGAGTPGTALVEKAQNRFLGRYGVVRDNWYKLSIDKISKIGDAEPVDPHTTNPDTPDDEIENFIAVHVHIVPWVLRKQSVQF